MESGVVQKHIFLTPFFLTGIVTLATITDVFSLSKTITSAPSISSVALVLENSIVPAALWDHGESDAYINKILLSQLNRCL
jgi:hypothetical protein